MKRPIVISALVAFLLAGSALVWFTMQGIIETPSSETKSWRVGNETGTYLVTNPTSESELLVQVVYPNGQDGNKDLRPVILVPGGSGTSRDFLQQKKSAQTLADAGYAVVLFDPEGRGKSGGEEDYNGFIGQDGLAEIIRFAWELQESPITIVSFSYGITMSSGVLARYPDLPVGGLIDFEGPADRHDTGKCDDDKTGHLADVAACDDEAFWEQREALNFIKQSTFSYVRLQTEKDHVQPDVLSAVRMVNAASEADRRVQLNDSWIKFLLSEDNPPPMLPETFDREIIQKLPQYIEGLFAG